MRVREQLLAQCLVAHLCAPDLRKAHEEALVARKAVDQRGLLAVERDTIRAVRLREPAQVTDVLAHRELAVDVHVVDRVDRVVLCTETRGAGIKRLRIVARPPIAEVAFAVGLAALVVEAVPDLVADHRADAAVIHGVVSVHVEERRLEDGRGKHDLVVRRVVVRVHRLRGHAPAGAVHRLAEAADGVLVLERARAHRVADEVIAANDDLRVITWLVGVSDLHREVRELFLGSRLGGRAHPLQAVYADRVCVAEILHQCIHPHLGLRAEEALDVQLAGGVAKYALGARDRALPARSHLLLAAQRPLAEVEPRLHERGGQFVGIRVEELGREVLAPRGCGRPAHDGVHRAHVIRLAHDHVRRLRELRGREVGVPVVRGRKRRELRHGHLVVRQIAVAALHPVPLLAREPGLEREDALCGPCGIGLLRECEHFRQVGDIRRARGHSLGVVAQVVVAVRHAEPGLVDLDDVDG